MVSQQEVFQAKSQAKTYFSIEFGPCRDAERESPFFAELPAPAGDMFAVAQLMLDVALVDLSNADRVKLLIKDL